MTQREQQILLMIEADPMITQEDLARSIGISRSSAAVHISNLMKKGYIAGKGYVVRRGDYAVVIGGVNIDIGGKAFAEMISRDSNPGIVRTSLGGVGRNISHNLRLLGVDTRLLTAFGDDYFAQSITDSCQELGIDISYALRVPGASTSVYLFTADCSGDMREAVSDMEICNEITPSYLAAHTAVINNARVAVADTNIPEESLQWLARNCTSPLFVDPVSVTKAAKLKGILGRIHTLKPNRLEAELLSGVKITDRASLEEAARTLLETGLKRVFISLGSDGVLAADRESMLTVPCFPAASVNTTGAGDAFMAGLVHAYMKGMELKEAAEFASAAAALAVESPETINPSLSEDQIMIRAEFYSGIGGNGEES